MKLAVFREKHANTYYTVRNEEDWYRVCMAVFRERDGMGYFYEPTEGDLKPPEVPGEDAPDWAEEEYNKKMHRYESKLIRLKRQRREWAMVEKARDGDLGAARFLIEGRRDAEYEGYTFEHLSKPDDSVPYWKVPASEQSRMYEDQIRKILEDPQNPDLYKEGEKVLERGVATQCEKPKNFPRKGEEFSGRPDRYLLFSALQRLVAAFDHESNDDAVKSAQRVLNRINRRRADE